MSQAIIERLISELRFTTYQELCCLSEKYDVGNISVTKALGKLSGRNEIITFKISRQTIYLSPEFYERIGIIQ